MRESRAYGAREPEFGYLEMRGYPCGRLATRYDLFWRGRNWGTGRTRSILPSLPNLDSRVNRPNSSPGQTSDDPRLLYNAGGLAPMPRLPKRWAVTKASMSSS